MRYETPEIIRLGSAEALTRGFGGKYCDHCACGHHLHPGDPIDT